MTATLKEQLAELAELAPRVHATTDRVNALVAQMEGILVKEMAIGLQAETKAFEEKVLANKGRVTEHLCLGSIDDQDQIHVIERTWSKDGACTNEERVPWLCCPRETRLKAIAALPDLVAGLVMYAKELMGEANETANKVAGWIGGEEAAEASTTNSRASAAPSTRAADAASRRRAKK